MAKSQSKVKPVAAAKAAIDTGANVSGHVISKSTRKILRYYVIIANKLIRIVPCKWNFKKRKFGTDHSIFTLFCRLVHFMARVGAVLTVTGYMTYTFNGVEFTSWDFVVCTMVLFWCSASVVVMIMSFRRPTFMADVLNRIMSINREYGGLAGLTLANNRNNSNVKMGIVGLCLAMVLGPLLVLVAWCLDVRILVEVQELLCHIFELLYDITYTTSMPVLISPFVLSLIVLCLACEYFAITEGFLWLMYGFSALLMVGVMKHCLQAHQWTAEKARKRKEKTRLQLMYKHLRLLHGLGNEEGTNSFEAGAFIAAISTLVVLASVSLIKMLNSTSNSNSIMLTSPLCLFLVFYIYFLSVATELFDSVHVGSFNYLQSYRDVAHLCSPYDKKKLRSYRPLTFYAGGCFPIQKRTVLFLENAFTINAIISILFSYR